MCVDLHIQISLEKHNWKKMFMQTQRMCVDLPFQTQPEKDSYANPKNLCTSKLYSRPS